MAWKAIRGLSGYKMGLCYADGQVIESPDNIVSNSILVVGNTPISCPSLPTNTGDLRFNIASNLYLNFNFNYVGDSSYRTNSAYCWAYIDNQTAGWWSGSFGCGGDYTRYSDILAFVDEENQKACFVWRYHYKYRWGSPGALYDQDSAERSNSSYDSAIYTAIKPYITVSSNGGGATHIAKVTGQLKDLSNNLSDILIVSGGGGGGLINGSNVVNGADAGGISGSGNNSANQSTGYAFGLGEDGANLSAGGAGLYGGYKGTASKGGGAGSGYIGNSLVANKKMVGYNVPTSSDVGTLTESVNIYDATKKPNTPKAGDGWARIKFLRNLAILDFTTVFEDWENTIYEDYTVEEKGQYLVFGVNGDLDQYLSNSVTTDGNIVCSIEPDWRWGFVYVIDCNVGDKIHIKTRNYPYDSRYKTVAVILKVLNGKIKSITKADVLYVQDATNSKDFSISNTDQTILIGMMCGQEGYLNVYTNIDPIKKYEYVPTSAMRTAFMFYYRLQNDSVSTSIRAMNAGGATIYKLLITTE